MSQTQLQNTQFGGRDVPTVTLASNYARRLVDAERRTAGTCIKTACAAVARRVKRPPSAVWALLFRRPKDVAAGLYIALEQAVERKIVRDIEDLENELAALRQGARRLDPRMVEEAEQSLKRLRASIREEAAS